jgi:hypothetical protein
MSATETSQMKRETILTATRHPKQYTYEIREFANGECDLWVKRSIRNQTSWLKIGSGNREYCMKLASQHANQWIYN